MATFEAQVNGITNLGIDGSSTDPGQTELTQFLKDGVIDVTNRCLSVRPQDAEDFIIESTESSSQGGLSTDGGKLLQVMRESGTNDDWRACRKIAIGLKDRVTDPNSLHFASAYNPAYILSQYGAVLVFPAPSGSSGQYRIYYVNKTPVDNASGAALAYGASTIRYFPDDKVYLVVIYASIKSLQASLASASISTFSLTAVPPDVPSISTVNYSSATETDISSVSDVTVTAITFPTSDIPTYTKPGHPAQVAFSSYTSGLSETDPGTTVVTAVPPDSITDTITDFSLAGEFDDAMAKAKALIDDAGSLSQGQDAEYWLNDEDPEMVASTVQVASQELQRANLGLQDALQTFNTDMQKFQASGTGKFSAEVAAYQAEVGAQVQDYTQKLQQYQVELTTAYQAWAKTESDNLQVFQSDIQNELNEFNMENADFQLKFQEAVQEAKDTNQVALQNMQKDLSQAQVDAQSDSARRLQDAAQNMQSTIADNASKVQKFQTEIGEYQAEVAAEVQTYQQELAEKSAEYQWKTARLQDLKQEYDQAFAIMAPPRPQQQQAQRRAG